jgi:hypothetical protein
MKKLFFIISVLMFAFAAQSQILTKNFTPDSNDSIVGAVAAKYCTYSPGFSGRWTGAIEVYLTSSVGANDSTWVTIEGSMDNSTWYIMDYGPPKVSGSGTVTGGKSGHWTIGAASGGLYFTPTWYFNEPYIRIKLQHYVAATSAKITRAKIHLKK